MADTDTETWTGTTQGSKTCKAVFSLPNVTRLRKICLTLSLFVIFIVYLMFYKRAEYFISISL